jgi:hypothetical protein
MWESRSERQAKFRPPPQPQAKPSVFSFPVASVYLYSENGPRRVKWGYLQINETDTTNKNPSPSIALCQIMSVILRWGSRRKGTAGPEGPLPCPEPLTGKQQGIPAHSPCGP